MSILRARFKGNEQEETISSLSIRILNTEISETKAEIQNVYNYGSK